MRLRVLISAVALVAAVALAGVYCASAQDDTEKVTRDTPVTITPPAESSVKAEADTSAYTPPVLTQKQTGTAGVTGNRQERRIDQRVDGLKINKPVKPEHKTPKNVMRIDDKNKRKVQPIAVIKSSLAPWGYTRRYLAGEVYRPEPKPVVPPGSTAQGVPGQPGAGIAGFQGLGGSRRSSGPRGSASKRDRD